jgi:iron complex outermembrane recepter protein
MKKTVLFFFFNYFMIFSAIAQYSYKGKVISNEDSLPLKGATVSAGKNVVATTDSNGNYSFAAKNSSITISFSHVGFEEKSVTTLNTQYPIIELNISNAFLAEAIVKAYEQNTKITNIPSAISVLNKADLERFSDASFVAAVNTAPGVKMDERSPGSYRLSIRGNSLRSPFGVNNVKVYWDGIPFTDANGNTYLQQVGFNNVDKIEIIKGPGGSMYGAGTGGVVLLTSESAAKNEKSILFNSFGGSYGLFSSNTDYLNGTDNSKSSLSIAHLQSDGYRQQTAMRRDVVNYTASFDVNNKQSLNTNIFYSDLYYQTPGGLTLSQLSANPQQARPAGGGFPSAVAQQAAVFVKTFYAGLAQDYQFNPHWSNTTSIYTSDTRFYNPAIRNYERRAEQGIGGRTVTQYEQGIFKLNFGGEYQYTFTGTRTFGNKLGNVDTLQDDQEINSSIYNVFAQGDFTLPKNFIINAGLSYNDYRYGFIQLNTLPAVQQSRNFTPEIAPRISVLNKINDRYSVYATVSKGFSPPTINEEDGTNGVFNKTLNAEDGINYELGTRGDIIRNKLFVDASYYIFGLNNTIVSRTDSSGGGYFVNEGETNQRGFELAVDYYPVKDAAGRFFKTIKLWSSYTNAYARFKNYSLNDSDYSGHKLPGTSPNVFVLGTDILTRPGLYANFTYNYTDKTPLDDANMFFADQYNLLSGRVGYKARLCRLIQSEIYVAFDKSFNTPYSLGDDLNAAGNHFYNPSAPQNIYGGIKLKVSL